MAGDQDTDDLSCAAIQLARAALPFDICCDHVLEAHPVAGRCQLWAGHEGAHAVMFVYCGERRVLTWRDDAGTDAQTCTDHRGLAWARGFPLPGWHETAGAHETFSDR